MQTLNINIEQKLLEGLDPHTPLTSTSIDWRSVTYCLTTVDLDIRIDAEGKIVLQKNC